jgi:uncharacterized protein
VRTNDRTIEQHGEPYWNPYVAGIGLGVVLLLAYIIAGRGLGASGAFTSLVAAGVNVVAPSHAQSSVFYKEYLPAGRNPLKEWLVFEILGVLCGGWISGRLAGRIRFTVEKSQSISTTGRFALAFSGGILLGAGSKLARGCTSGQALSGGALLSTGSWVFMLAVFAGDRKSTRLNSSHW